MYVENAKKKTQAIIEEMFKFRNSKVQGFKNQQVNIKYNNMITITKGDGSGGGKEKNKLYFVIGLSNTILFCQ